jgi:hypothetical protein
MNLHRIAVGALSFLMLAPVFASELPASVRKVDAPECRDLARHGSRIKQRLCGAPKVLDRYERERNELTTLVSDRAYPPNGISAPYNSFE